MDSDIGKQAAATRLEDASIGYAPYSTTLDVPGDRRRFCFYAAARDLRFEVVEEASSHPDVVIVAGTADITRWVGADPSVTIVYDLVDSYLALPRSDVRSIGRGVAKRLSGETSRLAWSYRKAIEAMCVRADAVVCSTEEQRQTILAHNSNVHVILDHHGSEVRDRKRSFEAHRPFRLVWEGLPYTLPAFGEISAVLERLGRRHPLEVHLVTDPKFARYARRFGRQDTEQLAGRYISSPRMHEWRIDTLADVVTSCDLAVIPALLDNPMFAGKPENKLLLFWRMGMPVVTSATPAYLRAMSAAGLDMACSGEAAWERVLEYHILDRDARELAARRGQEFVESAHSERRLVEQWDAAFTSVGFEVDR